MSKKSARLVIYGIIIYVITVIALAAALSGCGIAASTKTDGEGMERSLSSLASSASKPSESEAAQELRSDAPPTIRIRNDIYMYIGQTVSYKNNIEVRDDNSPKPSLKIDSSEVNTNKVGTYTVKVMAYDDTGHVSRASFKVHVRDKNYTEEEMWAICDDVLSKLGTAGMTDEEKVLAIYNFSRENVRYGAGATSTDWVKAAADGILFKKGDCYNVAMMLKALLTRAGVKNFVIKNAQEGELLHYWNVVDIGDGHGWYHLDGIVRGDDAVIYLWTQAQVEALDLEANYPVHTYDRSAYPLVP